MKKTAKGEVLATGYVPSALIDGPLLQTVGRHGEWNWTVFDKTDKTYTSWTKVHIIRAEEEKHG